MTLVRSNDLHGLVKLECLYWLYWQACGLTPPLFSLALQWKHNGWVFELSKHVWYLNGEERGVVGNCCHTDLILLFCHLSATLNTVSAVFQTIDVRKATKEEVYAYDCVHSDKDEWSSFGLHTKKNRKRQDGKIRGKEGQKIWDVRGTCYLKCQIGHLVPQNSLSELKVRHPELSVNPFKIKGFMWISANIYI